MAKSSLQGTHFGVLEAEAAFISLYAGEAVALEARGRGEEKSTSRRAKMAHHRLVLEAGRPPRLGRHRIIKARRLGPTHEPSSVDGPGRRISNCLNALDGVENGGMARKIFLPLAAETASWRQTPCREKENDKPAKSMK